MIEAHRLDNRLDAQALTCRAIVETPKGTRTKYDYDPQTGVYQAKKLLPEGMVFPLDFGFVPSTLAEDGDPVDILVLADEPGVVGSLHEVRLLGVIEAEQTEGDNTVRNDRIIAVSAVSRLHDQVRAADDLGDDYLHHLCEFWVQYNALQDNRFKVLRIGGPQDAVRCIEAAPAKD